MRVELAEILTSLTVDELLETRRYIDRLLEQLQHSDALARRAPEGVAEQRAFERYSIDLPVTYFRHAAAGEGRGGSGVEDAVVRDIARGGIRFFTHERLEREEILTFYLPGHLGVRKLFVEVRWIRPRGDQYECGAAFVALDRVFAAQRAEHEGCGPVQMLVAWEPCPEREALADLLVKQGYKVGMANGVPEAVAMLGSYRSAVVLGTGPMLTGQNLRLIKAVEARAGEVVSIALVEASELDDPSSAALLRCHDYIARPDSPHEVRLIVGRTYQRLAANRARRTRP